MRDTFWDIAHPPECIVHLPLRRGDAVIFTEALMHGTLPWVSEKDGERRALLFKYGPGHMQWEKQLQLPEGSYEWEDLNNFFCGPAYHREREHIKWPPARQAKEHAKTAAD